MYDDPHTPESRPATSQSKWWFVGGALAVAGIGLLSTRVGLRDLDAAAAGDLRGLLGAVSAISITALGLQLVLVGILSDRSRAGRMLRPTSSVPVVVAALVVGLLAGGVALLLIDSTASFEVPAAVSIGLSMAALTVAVAPRAVLLGEERWRELALISVVASLVRFAVTGLPLTGGGLGAALAGVVVGDIVAAAAALTVTRRTPRATTWPAGAGRHLRIAAMSAVGLTLIVTLSSVWLGRGSEPETDAFNQSASVARQVFVLAFTVAYVFFPAMARLPIGSVALRRHFHRALLLTAATAITAAAAVALFPALTIDLIGGEPASASTTTTLRLLVVAFTFYGIAAVSLMQYIAHGSRFALAACPLVSVMVVGQLTANTAAALAWFTVVTGGALAVVASMPALARVQPLLRPAVQPLPDNTDGPRESVTIVVPAYNPGPVVIETVTTILQSFQREGIQVEVIVVSDGSTDGSPELIDEAGLAHVTHLRHDVNRGKGAALRTGFGAASTPSVGFVDADGDLHPSQLVGMARVREETGADIVFGSKRHSDSMVAVPFVRRIYSHTFELIVRHLFQLDISDTQTGIKIYSRPVLAATLPVVEETGFALDLELFVAARANGFNSFVEVPVEMVRRGGSTIAVRGVLQMIFHTMRIFWRAKVTLHYLRAASAQAPSGQAVI